MIGQYWKYNRWSKGQCNDRYPTYSQYTPDFNKKTDADGMEQIESVGIFTEPSRYAGVRNPEYIFLTQGKKDQPRKQDTEKEWTDFHIRDNIGIGNR